MYHKVYSPDGEMFEVSRATADGLILNEGWTQTPLAPKAKPKADEKPLEATAEEKQLVEKTFKPRRKTKAKS